jgi:uncharacterized FlaG/YvyC family protein
MPWVRCGTAKEVAVQTQRSTEIPDTYDRLPPVERLAAARPEAARSERKRDDRAGFAVEVVDATPAGSVEVRYGLDPVANVWVASFFDGSTGEFVKTVPATRVMHQLAELRAQFERSVDRRA